MQLTDIYRTGPIKYPEETNTEYFTTVVYVRKYGILYEVALPYQTMREASCVRNNIERAMREKRVRDRTLYVFADAQIKIQPVLEYAK